MGKPERRMRRALGASKVPAGAENALGVIQTLPDLIQGLVSANKTLTDEQAKLKDIIGDILQEHENQLTDLQKRIESLESKLGDDNGQ